MMVINLFGVPSAGKSTGAAYIFSQLKMRGTDVELVTEFAKDKIWEDNITAIENQAYIFGEQSFRMSRCKDKVDIIVTDSPLLLSALYNEGPVLGEDFSKVVYNVFNSYDNMNYLIMNTKPYSYTGRVHSEEESNALIMPLHNLLDKYKVSYKCMPAEISSYDRIINEVLY